MQTIGIYGNIGVGKSTVCDILQQLGATVLSADKENSELLADKNYINEIEKLFPESVSNGIVDRQRLRQIVFSNEQARLALNKLAHPNIRRRLLSKSTGDIVFYELSVYIPDFIKTDKKWIVVAKDATSIARAAARDNTTKDAISKIHISQLLPDITDDCTIIHNDGTLLELTQCVTRLYNELKKQ